MLKTNTKVIVGLAGMVSAFSIFSAQSIPSATAAACTTSPCDTTFQVDVKETISVDITTPTDWATGNIDTFLRNTINIGVTTNNPNGFVVGMTTGSSSTALTNTAKSTATLPTLTAAWTRSSTTTNFWGYSLTDSSETGTYYGMVNSSSTPIKIFDSTQGTNKDVYFGAKADISQASGTYAGTVIFTVVSGATSFPGTPTNPVTPSSTTETAVYNAAPAGGTNGTTTYTYNTSGTGTTTTTTQISDGDNRDIYSGYTPPQGVSDATVSTTENNLNGSSSLATGLAVTAAVAATAGLGAFVLAKRREDDDDEEQA